MRAILIVAILVLTSDAASAQSRIVYGQDGRPERQIHSDQRGSATEYDARTGRVTGRATTGSDGTVTVYGEDGRVREKISPSDPRSRRP